jgi:hypothetical protein
MSFFQKIQFQIAHCRRAILGAVIQNVVMLSVAMKLIMLSVVMLNDIILSVVAPLTHLGPYSQHFIFIVNYE